MAREGISNGGIQTILLKLNIWGIICIILYRTRLNSDKFICKKNGKKNGNVFLTSVFARKLGRASGLISVLVGRPKRKKRKTF